MHPQHSLADRVLSFARSPMPREPLAAVSPCTRGQHLIDSLCGRNEAPLFGRAVTTLHPDRRVVDGPVSSSSALIAMSAFSRPAGGIQGHTSSHEFPSKGHPCGR
jgi:hypothetical protein